jgi:hypothetical protein
MRLTQVSLPPDLDFAADPTATPARMNRATINLNSRVAALETYKPNFDAALATIQQVGLDRLSEVLIPIYERLVAVSELGALFRAHSSTSLAVAAGPQTFVVDSTQASQFAPAAWIIAVNDAASAAMAGPVTSYDRTNGWLIVDVVEGYGSGTFASWALSPWAPTQLSAGTDDGDIDGPIVTPVIAGYLSPEATDAAAAAVSSASAAAASASAASASESAAAGSAGTAAGSASGAASSETAVSALLTSFRSIFLGAFASDSAAAAFAAAHAITLAAGVMYENTTETKFRIYSGSAWGDYDASAAASQSAAALAAVNAAASQLAAGLSAAAAAASAASILGGPVTSVDGLTGAVTGVELTSHKGAASGYASLDTGGLVPTSQIPSGASVDDGAI